MPVEPWLLRISLITILSITAITAVRPMLTYRALALGAGPFEVGLIAASFSLLAVLAALPIGRMVDQVGSGRFAIVAMVLMSIASLSIVWIDSLVLLAVAVSVVGFGHIMNLVAGQTMVANAGGRKGRESRYGLYSTAASTGQLLGPALAGLLAGGLIAGFQEPGADPGNVQGPVFLFACLATGVAALLAFGLPRTPAQREGTEPEASAGNVLTVAGRVLRRPGMPSAMIVSITVISAVDVMTYYLPAYGEANGLSVALVGGLLSVRAGASLVSRLFMSRLIQLAGRKVLLTSCMVMAAGALLLLVVVPPAPVLVLLMILSGFGLGLGQPMTIAWVANRSPRAERATALSIRLTGNRGALLVVPVTMGALAGALGVGAIFWVLAGLLGVGAAIAVRAPFEEDGRPSAERTSGPAGTPGESEAGKGERVPHRERG
jgi:MFS family permease